MSFPPLDPPRDGTPTVYLEGWDLVTLGGVKLPGRSRIVSGGVELKEDPKKKAGSSGTRPTYHGLDPQHIVIENEQFSDAQRDALQTACAKLLPKHGQESKQKPVALVHPSTAHLPDIVQVMVLGGTALIQAGARGVTKMTFKCRHWLAPKSGATATPKAPTRSISNSRSTLVNPLPDNATTCGPPMSISRSA